MDRLGVGGAIVRGTVPMSLFDLLGFRSGRDAVDPVSGGQVRHGTFDTFHEGRAGHRVLDPSHGDRAKRERSALSADARGGQT